MPLWTITEPPLIWWKLGTQVADFSADACIFVKLQALHASLGVVFLDGNKVTIAVDSPVGLTGSKEGTMH